MQETPCATIFQSAANCVHISRCRAKYIVAINISICVSRGAKLNSVELRKLQMTGGASYTISLPKDWVKEQGLKVGDVVCRLLLEKKKDKRKHEKLRIDPVGPVDHLVDETVDYRRL